MERDPLTGQPVQVLWVKGSGGDLGSIRMDGFATLYMDKLHALRGIYRGLAFEDEMVGLLPHCTFNLNSRAASMTRPCTPMCRDATSTTCTLTRSSPSRHRPIPAS